MLTHAQRRIAIRKITDACITLKHAVTDEAIHDVAFDLQALSLALHGEGNLELLAVPSATVKILVEIGEDGEKGHSTATVDMSPQDLEQVAREHPTLTVAAFVAAAAEIAIEGLYVMMEVENENDKTQSTVDTHPEENSK